MKFLEKHCSQCQAYKERADTYGMLKGDDDNDASDCLVGHNEASTTTDVDNSSKQSKQIEYKDKCC